MRLKNYHRAQGSRTYPARNNQILGSKGRGIGSRGLGRGQACPINRLSCRGRPSCADVSYSELRLIAQKSSKIQPASILSYFGSEEPLKQTKQSLVRSEVFPFPPCTSPAAVTFEFGDLGDFYALRVSMQIPKCPASGFLNFWALPGCKLVVSGQF